MSQQSAQQLNQLLLCDRERIRLPVQLQVPADALHRIDQFLMELRLWSGKTDEDILFHAHIREKQRLLWHHVYAAGQGLGRFACRHLLTIDINLSTVMCIDAHNDLH